MWHTAAHQFAGLLCMLCKPGVSCASRCVHVRAGMLVVLCHSRRLLLLWGTAAQIVLWVEY
jgi:hypothetical protein